jgi:hypothetical protein
MVAPKQRNDTPPEYRPAPDGWCDLPAFGRIQVSLSVVDPLDALRREPDARVRSEDAKSQSAPPFNAARFRREVILERARLALADPAGEADAVAPLSPVQARQILLAATTAPRTSTVVDKRDGTDLLIRLGGDPTRSSGRVVCPAHGGRGRNLAWRWGDRGRLLLRCWSHACSFDEIVKAVA